MQSRVDLASAIPLPADVRRFIAIVSDMPVRDILNWCQSEKQTQQAICKSVTFWGGLLEKRLGVAFENSGPQHIKLYQKMLADYDNFKEGFTEQLFNRLWVLDRDTILNTQFIDEDDHDKMFTHIGRYYIDVDQSPHVTSHDANIIVRAAIDPTDREFSDEISAEDIEAINRYIAKYIPLMPEEDLVTLALDILSNDMPSYISARNIIDATSGRISEEGRRRLFYGTILTLDEYSELEEDLVPIIEMLVPLIPQQDRDEALLWFANENEASLSPTVVTTLWEFAPERVREAFLKRLEEHVRNGRIRKSAADHIRDILLQNSEDGDTLEEESEGSFSDEPEED